MIFLFRRNKFLLHKPKRATSAYRLILCRLYTPLACYATSRNARLSRDLLKQTRSPSGIALGFSRGNIAYRLILCRLYTPLACYAITHNQRNCKQFQIQWELGHCTAKIDADRLCQAFAQQKC